MSTNETADRRLDLITKYSTELREQLTVNHIEIEDEDDNHWFAFRDPDNNWITAWAGGFGMDKIEIQEREVMS